MTNKKKIYLASGLFLLFISLIVLVKLNIITSFDNACYNFLAHSITNVKTNIYQIFTFLGSTLWIILATLLICVIFWVKKKMNLSYIVASLVIISTILNNVIKIIIRRARPTVMALVVEKSYSFPSGHTMASTTLYYTLLFLVLRSKMNKKLKIGLCIILSLLPILVGISRIYLGAHFASDVIGGYLLSCSLILISICYIDKKGFLL